MRRAASPALPVRPGRPHRADRWRHGFRSARHPAWRRRLPSGAPGAGASTSSTKPPLRRRPWRGPAASEPHAHGGERSLRSSHRPAPAPLVRAADRSTAAALLPDQSLPARAAVVRHPGSSTCTRSGATSRSCRERVNGRPLIWLDNAATTQKPQAVIDRLVVLLRARELQHPPRRARPGRPRHRRLRRAPATRWPASSARGSADEIVFVRGTTEAHQPGRQGSWGRAERPRGRRDRDLTPRAPRQHRALAAARRGRPAPCSR